MLLSSCKQLKYLMILIPLVHLSLLTGCGDGSDGGDGGFVPVSETVRVSSRISFAFNPDRLLILNPDQSDAAGDLFVCQISFGENDELSYELSSDEQTLFLDQQELSLKSDLEEEVAAVEGVPTGLFKRWSFQPVLIEGVRNQIDVIITDKTLTFENTCVQ